MVLYDQEIITEKNNSWKSKDFFVSVKENKQRIGHR